MYTENVRSVLCDICWNILENILGMSPELTCVSYPCMVKVFPDPVCPYAKMVE